ncbi:MAG: PHP domain-containing protein [Melioribacteraceae bacterium]|nr:PHP domain-containing protein [Melioribacteraceae bacterium]
MFSLHTHSTYSLLKGTITVERLIELAVDNKSKYASLTDTNGMYGLIQFAKIAAVKNIKPILGALIDDPNNEKYSLICIARNNKGYAELTKVITSRKLKDDFNLIKLLDEDLSNMFLISSSLKFIRAAKDKIKTLPNFYSELIVTQKTKQSTRKLYEFSKENGIKYIASHPTYFEKKEDYALHKLVSSIRRNSTMENINEEELEDEEFYFKSSSELKKVWKNIPEAIFNAEYIAEECNVNLEFGKYKFPYFIKPNNRTAESILSELAFHGLSKKITSNASHANQRLHYELNVIDELGFSNYFLIVWDIIMEAKRRRIITIGRGSVADSLVAYALDFTQVDPIKHNLYFERFLNRGRKSPPDIDIDFSWKERDEMIRYVFDKYGYEKVAMISTIITFRARSAFRETAKAFGIPNREISKYSKYIPWTAAKNLDKLSQKFPEAKDLNFSNEPWISITKLASRLDGFPHHLSIHPSGIVITPEPITNYTALEYASNKGLGMIITQLDMYSIEDIGLMKIDLLSQRALGVLRDTIRSI